MCCLDRRSRLDRAGVDTPAFPAAHRDRQVNVSKSDVVLELVRLGNQGSPPSMSLREIPSGDTLPGYAPW